MNPTVIKLWDDLMEKTRVDSHHDNHSLPGVSPAEWVDLMITPYDEVDRLYIEAETIGGG